MSFEIYDKAKYHYDAHNAPKDMPIENGATHISFIFLWCIEKDFYSKSFLSEYKEEILKLKNRVLDCRDFFMTELDGVFTSEDLNSKGKKFLHAYYTTDKTKFAKNVAYYLEDYRSLVEKCFPNSSDDNAYFYVSFNEENYLFIKSIIEKRYEVFLCEYSK